MQAVLVSLLIAVQSLVAPPRKESAPPAEPVLLQFKWPDELDARVESERSREQAGGTAKPARSVKATYRMRVRPHPSGMIVRAEEFSGLQVNDVILNGMGVQDLIASLVPSTVVTRAGEFVRAEDTAAVKTVLARLFEPFLSGREPLPPQFRQVFQQLSSDDFLNANAAAEWSMLVGAWLEFPLSDEVFEDMVEEPNPIMPDLTIPMKLTRRMVEKGECTRGGARYECGLFEMRSEVDRAALEAIMKRLLEGMREQAPAAVTWDNFELVTLVRVRLETATMLPHELTTTKTVDIAVSAPGMPSISARQVERRTSRFTY